MAENSDHEEERVVIELSESESDTSSASDAQRPELRQQQKLYCRYCGQQGHLGKDCPRNELQNIHRDSRRTRGAGRNAAATRLVQQEDNAGFRRWRDKKSAYSTFDFPHGFENATDIHGDRSRPLRIGHFTQTYIELDRVTRHGKYRAAIWAEEAEHNDAARKMLEEWRDEVVPIGSGNTESAVRKWAKSKNVIKPGSQRATVEAARKSKFTRDFAPTELFAKFYRVDWQLDGDHVSPQAVLGYQLEGLDSIRMDHEVYIKLIGKTFGVLGANEIEARKACLRLQNVQYNALAKNDDSDQFYLVKPVPYTELRGSVIHQEYAMTKQIGSLRPDGSEDDYKIMAFGSDALNGSTWSTWNQNFASSITQNELAPDGTSVTIPNVSDKLNALYIELWFTKVMQHQPYYLGQMQMRASIGTCLMTRRMNVDEYDLGTFCEGFDTHNRNQAGFESNFARELGLRDEESELLGRFMDDNAPLHANTMAIDMYHADGSLNMAPHTNVIEFTIENGEEKYELHLKFNNLESNVGIATWIKLDGDGPLLDINLFDLQVPHLSYNLNVKWRNVLGQDDLWKLPSFWTRFAELIRIDRTAFRDPNNKIQAFEFPGGSGGSLPITSFIQKQAWSFHIKDCAYTVELERFQRFDCNMDGFGIIHASPYEPRCGVQVYHPLWDQNLAENATLRLGYRAKWRPAEHEFFPVIGDQAAVPGSVWVRGGGIREWLRVMALVQKIVVGGYESEDVKRSRASTRVLVKEMKPEVEELTEQLDRLITI